MKPSSNTSMPILLKVTTFLAVLLIIATIVTGLYLGSETRSRFNKIDHVWRHHIQNVEERFELLSRLKELMGYGGIIHNFKNYVLRQNPAYLKRVQHQLLEFETVMERYKKNVLTAQEQAYLGAIEHTVKEYKSMLPVAIQAMKESWSPSRTDKFVKVDDTAAIQALINFNAYWSFQRKTSHESMLRAASEGKILVEFGFYYLGVMVLVALVIYSVFYLFYKNLNQSISNLSSELIERKRAEFRAKKFKRTVEQTPATIIISRPNGMIEFVNDQFCHLTGYQSKEVIGRTPRFLQSGDRPPESYLDMKRQLALGKEWRGLFRNKKKDGSHYWSNTVIFPLRDEKGDITNLIGIGEDVTERRKIREQIHKAQKMEAVGLLASGVVHDFNNVLTTIMGNVHIALEQTDKQHPLRGELDQIDIASKRARNLVRQILAFARKQPVKRMNVQVSGLLEDVCNMIQISLSPKISLQYHIEHPQFTILGDPTRLMQILMNLCSNSVEAIGAHDGEIQISVTSHATEHNAPMLRVTVQDNGPGIPENIRDKVFDPFFTTKPPGKGTGLGLPVIVNLIGDMGGQITLLEQATGTGFEILLPRGDQFIQEQNDDLEIIGGNEHIMMIDDKPDVSLVCKKLLEKIGYKVSAFTKPAEALAIFTEAPQSFDIVITDYIMPEINGIEVAQAVLKVHPECPILICTTFEPEELHELGNSLVGLVEKPLEPALLAYSIRQLLDNTAPKSPI